MNFKCVRSGSLFCVCGLISLSSWLFFMVLIFGLIQALFLETCGRF
jgi:hypothetical protein